MVRVAFILFIFFYPFSVFSTELNLQEKLFFSFVDFDKDKNISKEEIKKLTVLIFQLIDENKDDHISEQEIIELRKLIESFK
jgi:hypothetical protein